MNWFLQKIRRVFGLSPSLRSHLLQSKYLKRQVKIDLYLPFGLKSKKNNRFPCFIFNDGQDLPRMNFGEMMRRMIETEGMEPFAAVGLHAADRMREYGTADQPDYANRGDLATAYEQFVVLELIPWLQTRYRLAQDPKRTIIAGFSLGGLSAFDLLWRNPAYFHTVGVFSGALWWRSTKFNPKKPDVDRIAHTRVAQGTYHPELRFWFQTGTEDETNDRNKNGIIDAIDDTIDLIKALKKSGYQQGKDIHYLEIEGGRHEPQTWGEAMKDFVRFTVDGLR